MKHLVLIVLLTLSVANSQSVVGDSCELPRVGSGRCTPIGQCQKAIDDLRKGIMPQNCGFDGNEPIVCCVGGFTNVKSPGVKSIEKCNQYGNATKGMQIFGIAGGEDARPAEFPHMAALGFGDDNNIQWQCGGSLISETFVLTAAHCLNANNLGAVKHVRLGDIRLSGDSRNNQNFRIIRRIPHPSYKPPSVYHDVALVEIDRPVKYTPFVKPGCLHTKADLTPDLMNLLATGWGLTEFGGSASAVLQKVNLDVFTHEECKRIYRQGDRRLPQGIQADRQMCVGGKGADKDTCPGDSGGPLQKYNLDNNLHDIVGVTSFGKACGVANVPGVYSKVSYYVPWIESVVWQ